MSNELKPQSVDSPEFRKLVMAVRHCSWRFDGTQPEMAALIAHIDAWGARLAGVPDGWMLVPILSTDVMDIAGREMLRDCGHERPTKRDAELCWSAMIDAAPEAPCGS